MAKRILGSTGWPQEVPSISANQQPIFDTNALEAQIGGRIIYLDLWLYTPAYAGADFNQGGAPAFWTGMSGETPYYDIDDVNQGFVYIVTSDQQNLSDAIASSSRRIAGEIVKHTDISSDNVEPPKYAGIYNEYGPTHILRQYPLTPGETVHIVHNLDPAAPVLVWGYYTIQGEASLPVPSRPLQPNPNVAATSYTPSVVAGGETTTIHTVSDDYTDEITIDFKMTQVIFDEFDSPVNTLGSYVNILRCANVNVELPFASGCIGSPESNYVSAASWVRWLNGIPMQGVGAITLEKDGLGNTLVGGSFKRY